MNNIAVIGDRASVYGFAALGLDTYFVDETDEAEALLKRLADDGAAVVYMTEQLAARMPETLARLSERTLPAVIPIPGVYGNTGFGMRAVRDNVVKAVGSELV